MSVFEGGTLLYHIKVDKEGNLEEFATELDNIANVSDKTTRSTKGLSDALSVGGRTAASAFIIWDRLSIAQNAVENAQLRVAIAQDRLTAATEKYGSGSAQAIQAQRELTISANGLDIANQRMYVRMIFGTAVVLPETIAGIKKLIEITKLSTLFTNSEAVAQTNLGRARLFALAATGVGIPLAIAGLAAGMALSSAGPPQQSTDVAIYGDVNLNGVQNPQGFVSSLDQLSQQRRMNR